MQIAKKRHENYRELILRLALADFKLRYHGSVLGYVWALLKPLLLFSLLYAVFSSIFNPRALGNTNYSLELLVALLAFNFFAEGTMAGMTSLVSKSQLVTKIYVPRWTIVFASTLNTAFVFLMNTFVIVAFFAFARFVPKIEDIIIALFYIALLYLLILTFSFFMSPLFVRFRDLSMIWEVATSAIFYASPIIYPLSMMPKGIQQILLLNPVAFIIHFMKSSLIHHHWPEPWQNVLLILGIFVAFASSFLFFRKFSLSVAEEI